MTRIRKNDTVVVVAGKDKGKKGKVVRIVPEKGMAIVENVNMLSKHLRPTRENPKGGKMTREGLINMSNLMMICPRCQKKTRVGHTVLQDKSRKRLCKKCQELI